MLAVVAARCTLWSPVTASVRRGFTVGAGAAGLLVSCGSQAPQREAVPPPSGGAGLAREWVQTAGPNGSSLAVEGRLEEAPRLEVYPLTGGAAARGAMVARGDALYLVEPTRIRAFALGRASVLPRWQMPMGGRIGSGERPPRCVATDRGVIVAATTGRTREGQLVRPEIMGVAIDTGRPWFRLPQATGADELGLVVGANGQLITQRVQSATPIRGAAAGPEWLILDPDRGEVVRRAAAEEWVEAIVPIGDPAGDFCTENGNGHLSTLRRETLRSTAWEPWVHRDLKAHRGRLYAIRNERGGVYVSCFEPTGKRVWRWKCPASRPAALRLVTAKVVLVESAGHLWALDRITGRQVWKTPVTARPAGFAGETYLTDPFVDDAVARLAVGETAIVAGTTSGSKRVDQLAGLDLASGKTRWSLRLPYSLERTICHQGVLYTRARSFDGKKAFLLRFIPQEQ